MLRGNQESAFHRSHAVSMRTAHYLTNTLEFAAPQTAVQRLSAQRPRTAIEGGVHFSEPKNLARVFGSAKRGTMAGVSPMTEFDDLDKTVDRHCATMARLVSDLRVSVLLLHAMPTCTQSLLPAWQPCTHLELFRRL